MRDYHINVFCSEDDGGYIADIPDLEACSAFGKTPEEAVAVVTEAEEVWLAAARDEGRAIPRPRYRPLSEEEAMGLAGGIVGLEHDYATLRKPGRDDADRFVLHQNQLIENAVGLAAAANMTTEIHRVDGRDVCRVHVDPSGHPVDAEVAVADAKRQVSRKREFFVRLNNATRAIEDETERQRYIARRWGGR